MTNRRGFHIRSAAGISALLTATTLLSGCGSDTLSRNPDAAPSKTSAPNVSQDVALDATLLESALPRQRNVPSNFSSERNIKAWDGSKSDFCLSDRWAESWCAKAISIGVAGFTDMEDEELEIYVISLPGADTAERLFTSKGTEAEVGSNPPGDQIDRFEISSSPSTGLDGEGVTVRQGGVIARIEYTRSPGTQTSDQELMAITTMVVKRIQQAQRGENPTASVE
ncbi:hypothetical protein [Streptomyces fradiae]|uniref:hypothetical protein n=1 Tax=Streptomyces fradiae TaxID=1906 RepID=UPI002942E219|nr:hypothetical protein [Streptomyces fradiae]WOI62516.1 hypothetical protein RYQ63_22895 [Streptomyces fradiae]